MFSDLVLQQTAGYSRILHAGGFACWRAFRFAASQPGTYNPLARDVRSTTQAPCISIARMLKLLDDNAFHGMMIVWSDRGTRDVGLFV